MRFGVREEGKLKEAMGVGGGSEDLSMCLWEGEERLKQGKYTAICTDPCHILKRRG